MSNTLLKKYSKFYFTLLFLLFVTFASNASLEGQWKQISARGNQSLAIKSDNTLWILNGNSPQQLGADNNWQQASLGGQHFLAIKTNGTLWAWGRNAEGQLGDGTTLDNNTPSQIGTDSDWLNSAAGNQHSLAIKTNGTLWAWGSNESYQLGDGTNKNRLTPVQIYKDNSWEKFSAGENYSLAISDAGNLWAWGGNAESQLGDGTIENRDSKVQITSDIKWQQIEAGVTHSLAIKADGTLWAWGNNSDGQLGNGTNTSKTSPEQIGMGNNWRSVSIGKKHSLAVKNDDSLWVWGLNSNGQLGNGTVIDSSVPILVDSDESWLDIAAGDNHSLGLKTDSTLWAWGSNMDGELGFDGTSIVLFPVQSAPYLHYIPWKEISTADQETDRPTGDEAHYSVGIREDGTLWVWGGVNWNYKAFPEQIGSDNDWRNVSGYLAMKNDRTLWKWNLNENEVTLINNDVDWFSFDSGSYHTLAIKTDGTLWAWGGNFYGQFGDGTNTSINSPTQIGTGRDWLNVTAGHQHSLAIKTDGTLWATGSNINGQIGDGTNISRNSLLQIGSDRDWLKVAAGRFHSLAIKTDGSLWAWGRQPLGDGSSNNINVPVKIGSDNDWESIAAGSDSLAIKTDGALWSWGSNSLVQIGNDKNWRKISVGRSHSLAIRDNGIIWAWGSNNAGQLGNGTSTRSSLPVKAGFFELDVDGDGVADDQDALPYDVNEQFDMDNDGIGDNVDTDNDNDGLPDDYEIANNLDPFEHTNVLVDNDGDGIVLLDEYLLGSNDNDAADIPDSNIFTYYSFEVATESSKFNGDASWQINNNESYYGGHSFGVSGTNHNNSSSVSYSDTFNDGYFSFTLKTSTEEDYDFLILLLDDIEIERFSGEQDWKLYRYSIAAGEHTIKWVYSKDLDTSYGADSAWLDTISFPTYSVPDTDNDGVEDELDAFPLDASESIDTDLDGIGNNADLDDDGDGVLDVDDALPLDASETQDTDLDGIGNNADLDDDGDGLPDTFELANDLDPLDAADAALDNDSDGLTNYDEFRLGTNINMADTDGDGIDDNIDNNPLVFDEAASTLYSGQLKVLPDMTDDDVQEIGILKADSEAGQVQLNVLDGTNQSLIKTLVWTDSFADASLALLLIPDMNDNGFDEVGLFGLQDKANNEGKPQMFVRDLQTGNRVSVYNWPANWTEVSALVLDDISGDGIAEIAIQGRFKEGDRPQLVVKNGDSGSSQGTFGYPNLFTSPIFYQHSDANGDGFAEVATFGRITRNNKIQVKITNGVDSGNRMKAYNFPDKWADISWHRLDDSNGDGQDDWGLFGTSKVDGRPQLIVKDGTDPRGALRIHAWPSVMQDAQFYRIPDMNNDGVDDVAAAGRRSNNGRYQFQIQDGTDRNVVLGNHNLNLSLTDVTYHVLPDLSGDGMVEIGFMGINPEGEYELVIQHGDTLNAEYASHNLGSDWQSAPNITTLGDTDNDDLPDLLVFGQNAAADQLIIMSL